MRHPIALDIERAGAPNDLRGLPVQPGVAEANAREVTLAVAPTTIEVRQDQDIPEPVPVRTLQSVGKAALGRWDTRLPRVANGIERTRRAARTVAGAIVVAGEVAHRANAARVNARAHIDGARHSVGDVFTMAVDGGSIAVPALLNLTTQQLAKRASRKAAEHSARAATRIEARKAHHASLNGEHVEAKTVAKAHMVSALGARSERKAGKQNAKLAERNAKIAERNTKMADKEAAVVASAESVVARVAAAKAHEAALLQARAGAKRAAAERRTAKLIPRH